MCTRPIYIKNPNFGTHPANPRVDSANRYLPVPCGHCEECVAQRQSEYVQRVYNESQVNHIFFATLTYDQKHLPILDLEIPVSDSARDEEIDRALKKHDQIFKSVDDAISSFTSPDSREEYSRDAFQSLVDLLDDPDVSISDSDAELFSESSETRVVQLPYADIRHLQLLFKRMRDNNTLGRPFRYLACTELGSKRGRPHAHILFFVPKHDGDTVAMCESLNLKLSAMLRSYWAQNVGTRKNPVYESNFTYRERFYRGRLYRNFDCHYVNPVLTTDGVANVAYYVTKYIFKSNEREVKRQRFLRLHLLDDDEFNSVWNIVRSRTLCSKGLGLDAYFEPRVESIVIPDSVQEYNEKWERALSSNDLPADDCLLPKRLVIRKTRKLVPNKVLAERIRTQCVDKWHDFPVFVGYNGEISPLCRYFQRRPECFGVCEALSSYYYARPEAIEDAELAAFKRASRGYRELAKGYSRYLKALKKVDEHDAASSLLNFVEDNFIPDPYELV